VKSEPRRICVVTGSRADYGLLCSVLREIQQAPDLQLKLMATGMHLSPEYGFTYRQIENDGFRIDAMIEMLLSSDSGVGVAKSMGLGIIGFADAFDRTRPDLLLLLGDRFEILAAAQAALVQKLPIAHLFGGDTTEGAFDEMIRHSLTKMSHLHFVTNAVSARRVRQLGENPAHIFNVGNPALDLLRQCRLFEPKELERELGFRFRQKNVLVTFHPSTLDKQPAVEQCSELLRALEGLGPEVGLLFTKPNADTEGRAVSAQIDDFTSSHPNSKFFISLGATNYWSAVRAVDVVVGNSSSGLYEVPSLKRPTVNVGDRQKGRLRASSVIDCVFAAKAIQEAIRKAFALDCSTVENPYGDGRSAPRIVEALRQIQDFSQLLPKHFFDCSLRE